MTDNGLTKPSNIRVGDIFFNFTSLYGKKMTIARYVYESSYPGELNFRILYSDISTLSRGDLITRDYNYINSYWEYVPDSELISLLFG